MHIFRTMYQRGSLAGSSASNTFLRGIGPTVSIGRGSRPSSCVRCSNLYGGAPAVRPHYGARLAGPALSRARNRKAGGHKRGPSTARALN